MLCVSKAVEASTSCKSQPRGIGAEVLCSRYQADVLLGLAFFPLALLAQSPFSDARIPILARMRRQSNAGVISEETAEVGPHRSTPSCR